MEEKIENKELKGSFKEKLGKFHDKYHKLLLLIPLTILLFCFIYMGIFYSKNNDFIYKDISLTGGTSVTLYEKIDTLSLKQELSGKLEDISVREVYDLLTREQKAVIIETKTGKEESKKILEDYLGYGLIDGDNASFEFTGSTLSENFYKQLLIAILFAFAFMAIVVFFIFKTFVPSVAVIFSAFSDIFMTLVVANIFGMKMSSAGIIAFLMIIGYSVDTDILLTTRILKREGVLNKKIFNSFKTGITMTLTTVIAMVLALIIIGSFSAVLNQIFTILAIGLCFDILNTWVTNVSILKWYVGRKK